MPDAEQITDRLQELAASAVAGRRVVIVCGVLAGATGRIEALRRNGASDVLVLALGTGTGDLPAGDDVRCVVCPGAPIRSIADEIRVWQQFVAAPPQEALDALAAFDPDCTALALCLLPVTLETYQGRDTLGGRPPAYTALEDKTLSLDLWSAAGVPHVEEIVLPVERDTLRAAAARLDQGHGTVWSADASDGMNGGADRVFWVRDDATATTAYEQLASYARCARLMPFLEGVPCSIHGIVLPDGVAALRPVELIVLRRPDSAKFVYAGISTGWDPAPTDREAMRDVARRAGAVLAERHGYRGAFGIDGVLTADGFRPHELNPRFSGGISTIGKGLPDLPLDRLHDLVLRGVDPGIPASDLEQTVVQAADAARYGSVYTLSTHVRPGRTTSVLVRRTPDGLRLTRDVDAADGELQLGPHLTGALVRYTPRAVAPGPRLAPLAPEVFALSDRLWGTALGPLAAAPAVR
ncbi:hypothetical protein [Luteipulveratus flavus]|uniref:ATP-grasp domain-containing protein n=1 Tax=Luteipulveratus flavus TaxID=3031728 RepID=A0ABT6C309_9MICO|nr:hypothetical protein [Luteipulveratus sp. YIM 133296]MDF8263242.1 hypothetical protein [Luteipulveratus sp. YIM 133296]